MNISITGRENGKLRERLLALGAVALSCDITNPKQVEKEIRRVKPDVIIHAAAVTSVDDCHRDYEKAIQINVRGTNHVCEAASNVLGDGRVVLLSTDHVFDGKFGNYKETDDPLPASDEEYGLTKFAAEGIAQLYGGKILRMSKGISKEDSDIQIILSGRGLYPTFIKRSYCHLDYLAVGIWAYANRFDEMPEILHLGGTEVLSFAELAKMINPNVLSRDYEEKGFAPRPYNCGLDVSLARKYGLPLFTPKHSVERLFL
jgi:dTDP-4-dehydrorhamnose reductase